MDENKKQIIGNITIEQNVISALISDFDNCKDAFALLSADCFVNTFCRKIYGIIKNINNSGYNIDLVSIMAKTDSSEQADLINISSIHSCSWNVFRHVQILVEMKIRRQLLQLSSAIQTNALDMNFDIIDTERQIKETVNDMFNIGAVNVSTIDDEIDNVIKIINKNKNADGSIISGTGTGLTKLDDFTGGLQPTDLVVIAGETSQGKTSLALTIAKNAAMLYNAKVVFYSLEMSKTQLVARLIAQEAEVNSKSILTKSVSDDLCNHIINSTWKLSAANIFFDDTVSTRIDSILNSIRLMKRKCDINLVVVDYLQLVSCSERGLNREQQVATIARALKNIAKELNICVIILSQLRRDDNPRPSLNRLRDSGQIEEAADLILLTYRPEVYKREYEKPFHTYSPYGSAMIYVAKGRNTGTTQFIVSFKDKYTLFSDYIATDYEPVNNDPF
ncbi:MAG: AAA family ATPase [Prevotellaceae bacterium]|jgi:replicative DNA helicase|nr:AAA family ATPase [Prevotellaceae bacterium]